MIVIFVLAVVPNPIFDLAGVAAGAVRIPVVRYLAAAASGKILKNVIIAGGASTISAMAALVSRIAA
jgi:uncharacterized membrane protein YdjX (TVP38/TMEM64 family)